MSDFAKSLLSRINYHKSITSSENAIKTLSNINPKLNDTNIYTLAYLSQNEAISDEERAIYMECFKTKAMHEYEIFSMEIEKLKNKN